ncbi:MAG TPA: hypothetical protein ENJ42_07690 [Hellea balneolensis]|uniref:Uncharacterized protein n=1 Tax=Hellea balneolensis TaxID=287478 RepID=A0A7C5QWU6_9PROT|nr:hypothetical protein [Hellea balneolensis]
MSYQRSAKRETFTLIPKVAIMMILAFLWILMSVPAAADPPKDPKPPVTEDVQDAVKDTVKDQIKDMAKDTDTVPVPNPKGMAPTQEAVPEDEVMELPKTDTAVKATGVETPSVEAPEPEATETLDVDASYHCYPQDSGKTECICKGEQACEALKQADICAVGSEWGKDELAGCTQKTE